MSIRAPVGILVLGTLLLIAFSKTGAAMDDEQRQTLAQDAYIYAYPLVENYLSLYQYALDSNNDQFKAPINEIGNVARVFTPADTGVVTPNSDTPYSFLVMDLRSGPLVVALPEVDPERYYSVQLIDLYTHNVDYLGTRRDGNGGGLFLIAGPGWEGRAPEGIKRVIHMPTELGLALYRTQLKGPADLANVKRIQDQYTVRSLAEYLGGPAPASGPEPDWPAISRASLDADFWDYANFLLQFAPPLAWETELRQQFSTIGLQGAGSEPIASLPADEQLLLAKAAKIAKGRIAAIIPTLKTANHLFGDPQAMKRQYTERAVGAMAGLYGNTAKEAIYPVYMLDAAGKPLDASRHNYTLRFAPGALPPVSAFWSLTMYDAVSRYLVDNSIDRYLINSPMLPDLVRDEDGGITLYLQHDAPAPERRSNWLPAPDGPMSLVLRLYLPRESALNGQWSPPSIQVTGTESD